MTSTRDRLTITDAEVDEAHGVLDRILEGTSISHHTVRLMLEAAAAARPATGSLQGQGEPCYYCGEQCDHLAGNPSKWPIVLCHRDEPGKPKWHHTGCVTARLVENQTAPQAGDVAERLRKIVSHAPVGMPHGETILEAADLLTAQAALRKARAALAPAGKISAPRKEEHDPEKQPDA